MDTDNKAPFVDLEAFNKIVSALSSLDSEAQRRVFQSVIAFLGLEGMRSQPMVPDAVPAAQLIPSFSEDRDISPKDFLREKRPLSDVQRVAVLGYYLAHYRGVPHFKTLDISKLNTEAAQPKFSNAAKAVDNAATRGYLVPATKGSKQLSSVGEQFVEALPDIAAAKAAAANARPRRRNKRTTKPKAEQGNGEV